MFHSVKNIGDTNLIFTTVEFMQSANPPMALPDGIRAKAACSSVIPGTPPMRTQARRQ